MHPYQRIAFLSIALFAILTLFAFADANFFNHALAATDPFAKATTKGNELASFLKGSIAVVITTVVISVVGILMLMSRVSHLVGVRIIIGALLIGGAASIAEWAYA